MELGMIGLGRMGMNMAERLIRDAHRVVGTARTEKTVREAEKLGVEGASSVNELVTKLKPPRHVWMMVPAGEVTEDVLDSLLEVMEKGDTIIDGGNSNYRDTVRRAGKVEAAGLCEDVTVEHRAAYYDRNGVLRDMFQNHLLQLLALTAMEPSVTFEADALRNEKAKVLQAIRGLDVDAVAEMSVRGQYEGYRDEEGVEDASQTATYAALELYVDNWRWQGVPFFLRSGKGMARKASEIVVCFKRPPHPLFVTAEGRELRNTLSLCLQPDEGVHLKFEAKIPDREIDTRPVSMEFHYATAFGGSPIPDAYERLLLDLLDGDATLFTRADEIDASWEVIDAIHAAWCRPGAPPLEIYPRGSWAALRGPADPAPG